MSALEVSLPLNPLVSSTYWAWLIALCVATIATFSRLSDLPFLMGNKLISKLLPSSRPVNHQDQLTRQKEMPCEAEKVGNKFRDSATCTEQEEERKEEERFVLQEAEEQELGDKENEDRNSRRAGEGRKRGVFIRGTKRTEEEHSVRLSRGRTGEEEEEEERENLPPLWVYSILEASRTPSRAFPSSLDASSISTPSSSFTSSWIQALNTRISARVGKPWDILEAYVPPRVQPCPTSSTSNIWRNWPCQQRHILHVFQAPPPLLASVSVSALEVGSQVDAFMYVGTPCHAFMHVGFCSGEIWLWDIEKGVCANCMYGRKGHVSAFGMIGEPVAIAAGPDYTDRQSLLVSLWDDRCVSRNLECGVTMPAGEMAALACRAFDVCIGGGEGYVSMHDARMVREEPLYVCPSQCESKVNV